MTTRITIVDPITVKVAPEAETTVVTWDPDPAAHLDTPHVATLPDGTRINLPAGTVLREGTSWEGPPADPLRDLCAAFRADPSPALATAISKLREQVDRGALPLLERARDLLRGVRADHQRLRDEGWLHGNPAPVYAAISAFLAGESSDSQR